MAFTARPGPGFDFRHVHLNLFGGVVSSVSGIKLVNQTDAGYGMGHLHLKGMDDLR